MAAVTGDQVTKTKLILYQSVTDVVQLALTIFPVFIHHPGMKKILCIFFSLTALFQWPRKVNPSTLKFGLKH